MDTIEKAKRSSGNSQIVPFGMVGDGPFPSGGAKGNKVGCEAELMGGLEGPRFRGARLKGGFLRKGIAERLEETKASLPTQISVKACKSSASDRSQ